MSDREPTSGEALTIGDLVTCPDCGEKHKARSAYVAGTEIPTNSVIFLLCPTRDRIYVVGIDGKRL